MRSRLVLAPAVVLLVLPALGLAPVASSDVIRLRSGETVKGRLVIERTNEEVLVIEDFLSGAVREFAWIAVDPADAGRVKKERGIEGDKDATMACDLLEYRLDDGSVVPIKGEIVKEEGGYTYVRNRSQPTEPLKLATNRIVSRTRGECDAQEIYPPEELAERRRAQQNPQDARGWLLFAQYAEAVSAWLPAKEGYEIAAADETFLNREIAKSGAARVEAILRDKEALDTVTQLKVALTSNQWKRVRDGIEGFATKHPSAGEAVKKKVEALKADLVVRRKKFFSEMAGRRVEPIVRNAIKKRVAAKDAEYNAVQGWVKREAEKELFDTLLAEMVKLDAAVTPEEVKTFWEARPKKAWKSARYGAGTRFVEPPKIVPKTGTKAAPSSNNNGGPAPVLKLPEPPTRDEWWKELAVDSRVEFWWAVFAEKSGLFEVDPKKGKIPCDKCDGEGVKAFTLSNGMSGTSLCTRCGGARYDLVVKYR